VKLSPAYDLVNSTIVLPGASEELALPLNGKKRRLTRNDFVRYFGGERLELPERATARVLETIEHAVSGWEPLVRRSFLPDDLQDSYLDLVRERARRLSIGLSGE
jgi:serine/threonine-protein kinase HipA